MKWQASAIALLCAASETLAGPSMKHKKYDTRLIRAERLAQRTSVEQYTPRFLNDKTRKFAINGSALPEVDFSIGEAYGGNLPIDDTGKSLYFIYIPSTNPAAGNEITLWLNGGPGCSSLDGFFHENGPAIWQAGTYRPTKNTYAWTNLTNMVWVDQPIGTGFSLGTPNATDELDVARQFRGFWKNFIDVFDLHNRDMYLTGESYAGQYVPYITDGFIEQNDTSYFNVKGMMIYDPSIGYDTVTDEAPAVAFVDAHPELFPFNDTFKAQIHQLNRECGYEAFLNNGLQFPPKGPFGPPPGSDNGTCDVFDLIFNEIFEINPCFDIYQVGQLCPLLWDVLGFPYSNLYLPPGYSNPYFNQTAVKKAINAPQNVNWSICTNENVFVGGNDNSPPSGIPGGPLGRVIEHTNNVIVGHGALDMVLISNGTLLTLNNLTWNGAQGFSSPPTKPFYVPYHDDPNMGSIAGAGIFGSWTADRGLTYVTVDLSGHEIPEYQPSSAYRTLEKLLGRIKSLDQVSGFTTQPDYPQSQQPLGAGTGPY